ncbi:glucose-6-phosphate isomerase [Striga asiatica]|uniref:Glucose-6-phosphate isomerase n=1 Tax=Striga asiatica TaxID=4170 RepID=A0A5A7P2Y6_STRAF|nr:glucose-6-phosphate isomerase [Striga asiatica]
MLRRRFRGGFLLTGRRLVELLPYFCTNRFKWERGKKLKGGSEEACRWPWEWIGGATQTVRSINNFIAKELELLSIKNQLPRRRKRPHEPNAVMLYMSIGSTKSRGMKPTAPTIALMSPKKGSIAATDPQTVTYNERRMILGIRFRMEKMPRFTPADFFSMIS